MNWFQELFLGSGVAHSILLLAIVIAVGVALGKVKVKGVSLGVTWVLFAGIVFAHFGMQVDSDILHIFKEFGLILFVFSIGLQVGPGFFSSFKKGGIKLNMLAAGIVLLGVVVTYIIHLLTDIPLPTMVGIMSGAVTNTPGLGAAQQANMEITGVDNPDIATGYSVAYPLAVVGIIGTIVLLRYLFRVNIVKESQDIETSEVEHESSAHRISLRVTNPSLAGMKIKDIPNLIERDFVISRIRSCDGDAKIAQAETELNVGDEVLIITSHAAAEAITTFIGEKIDIDWDELNTKLVSRRIIITKSDVNGKTLAQLKLRRLGVSVTRVNRSGIDLVAAANLQLQVGDRVTVVGVESNIASVEKILGNSVKRLNHPNLFPIFFGIVLGIILGSIPIVIPGIPQPVKLGLAGGPLIVAILIGRFGPKYKLVTYTTESANLMLREIGISLFLACVGLGAGETFVDTVVNGGYKWIGYGVLITIIPIFIIGIIGRKVYKLNYFTLSGLLAGAMTDPPALAYANEMAGSNAPSISYATVYPLTMFLRVLCAQLMILLLM